MKNLFIALALLVSFNSHAFFKADIVSTSKTVASAATPEALVAAQLFSFDAVIQAKSTNTAIMTIGPCSGSQDFELAAGVAIAISDIFVNKVETAIDLNLICLDVGVNGEGANILHTVVKRQ